MNKDLVGRIEPRATMSLRFFKVKGGEFTHPETGEKIVSPGGAIHQGREGTWYDFGQARAAYSGGKVKAAKIRFWLWCAQCLFAIRDWLIKRS